MMWPKLGEAGRGDHMIAAGPAPGRVQQPVAACGRRPGRRCARWRKWRA